MKYLINSSFSDRYEDPSKILLFAFDFFFDMVPNIIKDSPGLKLGTKNIS